MAIRSPHHLCNPLLGLLVLTIIPICNAKSILHGGEILDTDQSLVNGKMRLTIQYDCNLVLHENDIPVWATGTYGEYQKCYLFLTRWGNLEISTSSSYTVWSTNTLRGDGHYMLVLQEDRNLILYGDLWSATGYAVNANRGNSSVVYVAKLNNTSTI